VTRDVYEAIAGIRTAVVPASTFASAGIQIREIDDQEPAVIICSCKCLRGFAAKTPRPDRWRASTRESYWMGCLMDEPQLSSARLSVENLLLETLAIYKLFPSTRESSADA
jgi:hypothetical protein